MSKVRRIKYEKYEKKLDVLNYRSQVRRFAEKIDQYMMGIQELNLWRINGFIARFLNEVLQEELGKKEIRTTSHQDCIILESDSNEPIELGSFIVDLYEWYRESTSPNISKREYKNDFRDYMKETMFDLVEQIKEEILSPSNE